MKLNEINMSPSNLKAEAARLTDALVGLEFELIVKDVGHYTGDDSGLTEPDYGVDESINDHSEAAFERDIMQFFRGEYNSRSSVQSSITSAISDYHTWRREEWNDYVERELGYWVKEHYPEDDDNPMEHYDEFETEKQSDFYEKGNGMLSDWANSQGLDSMQVFADRYDLDWPYYTTSDEHASVQIGNGNRDFDEITNSFSKAVGIKTMYNVEYGQGQRGNNNYVMEPDGSLRTHDHRDVGLEFVSPPMSIDEMIDQIHKVKVWALDDGNAYTNKTCGLHMNVSFPKFDLVDLDYVKLAIFLGDEWVSSQFGRLGNEYAKSAMQQVKHKAQKPDAFPHICYHLKKSLTLAASKLIHSGITDKYTSINTKHNRVEFRAPGGNWLEGDINIVINTMLRVVVALDIALNPEKHKKEYASKLYKLISPTDNDALGLFAMYQSGSITSQRLKELWASKVLQPANNKPATRKATDLARKITGRKFWYLVKKNMYGRGDHIATIQAPDFAQAVIKAKHYVDQNNIIGDWEVTSAD